MSEATELDKDVIAAHAIMRSLADDPDTGPQLERLIAKKHPAAASKLPRMAAESAVAPVVKRLEDTLAGIEKRDKERETNAWLAQQRRRLVEGFRGPDGTFVKIDAADIPKIEKQMYDDGIAQHEHAAFLFHTQRQAAKPRTTFSSSMQIPGRKGAGGEWFKGIMDDPDEWARDKAGQIWDDIKNGRGQQWLDH